MSLRRGFTLIELLVVLSIITLLIAMLMPALGSARRSARNLQCLASLQQHNMAFANQMVESKTTLPEYVTSYIHLRDLKQYLNDMDPGDLACPEAGEPWVVGAGGTARRAFWWKAGGEEYTSTYTLNGFLYHTSKGAGKGAGTPGGRSFGNTPNDARMWWGSSLDNVSSASETPVFADGNWPDVWPDDTNTPPPDGTGTRYYQMERVVFDRHANTTTNLTYVDGHGETIPVEGLWQQKWHRLFDTQTEVSIAWAK